jgi:hypothetical protein
MLLLNKIRVIAVYIFESSWMKVKPITPFHTKPRSHRIKTRGNRISSLHDHISRTSTAVVKYLPPVIPPKYDKMGRRIKEKMSSSHENRSSDVTNINDTSSDDILLLKSSIRDKTLCENDLFVRGFMAAVYDMTQSNRSTNNTYISIDTLAHNHMIVDVIKGIYSSSWKMVSSHKWYYILYNAIVHQEIMCKDVCII